MTPEPLATTERLEAEVCTLAGQIAAATCRFVEIIAELDRRGAWREWGCRSMAHWLSWKCALGLVAAREHVRVGRALGELPRIAEAFAHGRLSYSKVRALTRVATPESEADLLGFASVATAAQLDRTVRAYVRSCADPETEAARLGARGLSLMVEADGSVTIRGRLTPEQADLVRRALEQAERHVPHDEGDGGDDTPPSARRADALEVLARAFLAGRAERVPTEVVVHVQAEQLAAPECPPALARILCDTGLRAAVHTRGSAPGDGETVVSRRTRTIPVALRRAIEHRDAGCCRFPGCTNERFLHVHHIVHFAQGGATDAGNCVLLCTFHHRAVHDGGWRMFGNGDGRLVFLHPHGRRIVERPDDTEAGAPASDGRIPEPPAPGIPGIDARTIDTALADPLDLVLAVHVFHEICRSQVFRPDRN